MKKFSGNCLLEKVKVKVDKFFSICDEDFQLMDVDEPDVGVIKGNHFDSLVQRIKDRNKEELIQRIDVALIKGNTFVFILDQWENYKEFNELEPHCSLASFKKMLKEI